MTLYKTDKKELPLRALEEILTDLTKDQQAAVAYGIETSEFLHKVENNGRLVAIIGHKRLRGKIAYLGVFYVLPEYRRTRKAIEAIKFASELLLQYTVVRYTPLIGSNLPIRYCKRRIVDVQQAYKDTHNGKLDKDHN